MLYQLSYTSKWSWNSESNREPTLYESVALPVELFQHWSASRLDCHTLMCSWRPASIPTGHSWAKSQGRRISSRSFQRALSFSVR